MERDLDTSEFGEFHDLIHRLTGIHYPAEKLPLLSNRLRKRLRACSLSDYRTYLRHVTEQNHRAELQQFIDSITTNETYFFRCRRHWDLFSAWAGRHPGRSLRIWSAACSSGCEAYTALIALEQLFGRQFGGRSVEVLGTDLNLAVLDEARAAIYRPYALAQSPPEIAQQYFREKADGRLELDRRFLRHATFRQHNLMDPLAEPPFDFVFLRNVMIYFDSASKQRVLQNVHRVLRPGGVLLVGESESLLNVPHPFTYVQPSWFEKSAAEAPPSYPGAPPRDGGSQPQLRRGRPSPATPSGAAPAAASARTPPRPPTRRP
ncbi:MAG: protein-glutamate O-methyltransferase CheR [Planctomycetota bacterium]